MICSLSIPIVTICALILLIIMVSLFDFIFRWLPWFIICFPLPGLKAKKTDVHMILDTKASRAIDRVAAASISRSERRARVSSRARRKRAPAASGDPEHAARRAIDASGVRRRASPSSSANPTPSPRAAASTIA